MTARAALADALLLVIALATGAWAIAGIAALALDALWTFNRRGLFAALDCVRVGLDRLTDAAIRLDPEG